MVKKLPLSGVITSCSCDGFRHGIYYSWIGLPDQDNLIRIRNVVSEVSGKLGIANLGEFIHHAGNGSTSEYHCLDQYSLLASSLGHWRAWSSQPRIFPGRLCMTVDFKK
jgi:hypothetical protein